MKGKCKTKRIVKTSAPEIAHVEANELPGLNNSKSTTSLFIRKAAELISSCPPEIAGWSVDGESFYVHNIVAFARDHIPKFYRHSKYASFVRQLREYSFHKIANKLSTETYHVFKHSHFVRDKPELMCLIHRGILFISFLHLW